MGDSHSGSEHRRDDRTNVTKIINEVEEASGNHVTNISEVEDPCGNVVISIQKMLNDLPPYDGNKCNIHRVPKQLRMMNDRAYGPQFISIGPFHYCSRNDLIATERYKVQGLKNYLCRIKNKKSLEELVREAQTWVKDARICYAEPINMEDLDFVKMMLVDGCFIVEYLILDTDQGNLKFSQIQNSKHHSFYEGIGSDIYRDLTKLENQVPFCVLQHLFELIPQDVTPTISFIQLTIKFFKRGWMNDCELEKEPSELKHFVEFLRCYYLPWPEMQEQCDEKNMKDFFLSFFRFLLPAHWQEEQDGENNEKKHWFFRFLCCCHRPKKDNENMTFDKQLVPPSITELCEAGVTIKKQEKAKCLMSIRFKNGVLKIPPLTIDDNFETITRNVIAFEQFIPTIYEQYVTQYIRFLDEMISTERDVDVLVKAGIIINNIGGSDKEVSRLFNNLCKFVAFFPNSHFDKITKDLRQHCSRKCNKWMASLKHNYFNTPWTFISFLAATFLIVLTLLQTIFAVVSISK